MSDITVAQLVEKKKLRVEDGNHGNDRPRSHEFVDHGVNFIRAADMTSGKVDFSNSEKIDATAFNRIRKGIGEPGDVLVTHKGTIGKVAFVSDEAPEFVCSPQTTFWRSLDQDYLNQSFIGYWLKSTEAQQQFRVLGGQSDMAPYVSLTSQRSMTITVPEVSRQRAIADVLGALDDKIAANERLSGAVQDLLQERFALLRLDGFTGDGSFLTVSDLFDVNPRTSQKLAGQAPYLGMKDLPDSSMTVGSWSTREAKSGARFINGDVLLARITPCLENGKAGYVDFLENTEVGVGSTEFIVFRARSPLLSAVPFFLTKSERFRDFAIKHMQGTSGRQRLAAADVADYRLAKVDDESLNRFGELSLSLLKRVKTAVSESRALARTRDELLPLLMNGKITVKDAEAVVSDAV